MSDNPRPALYGSEHKLFNISGGKAGEDVVHAVSGRHCESGDLLVKDAMLPSDTVSGDILMSTSTGAYTFAMASNYNRVPKSGVLHTNSGVLSSVNDTFKIRVKRFINRFAKSVFENHILEFIPLMMHIIPDVKIKFQVKKILKRQTG